MRFLIAAMHQFLVVPKHSLWHSCCCCIRCMYFKYITHDQLEADAAQNACALKCFDINYSLCSKELYVPLSLRRPGIFSEHVHHRQQHHGCADIHAVDVMAKN